MDEGRRLSRLCCSLSWIPPADIACVCLTLVKYFLTSCRWRRSTVMNQSDLTAVPLSQLLFFVSAVNSLRPLQEDKQTIQEILNQRFCKGLIGHRNEWIPLFYQLCTGNQKRSHLSAPSQPKRFLCFIYCDFNRVKLNQLIVYEEMKSDQCTRRRFVT